MTQGTASGKYGWPGRITPSPAACGPQIDESHWGSIASPAPPTPASSPGQCRMSRDPLRSVARRVRCPGRLGHKHRTPHTAAARRSTSSEREKTKVVTSPCKNEEADRAQRSAIPTAVLPGQECARGRHTHTPSGRHPLVRNAAEKDASPPRQTSSSSSTAAVDPEGQPPLPSLWPPGDQADDRIGSVWMRGLTPRGKDACRALIRLPLLTRWHPSLMPLDRTQNAARARGCWRSSHDGRLT
jgi:hypothetical protein